MIHVLFAVSMGGTAGLIAYSALDSVLFAVSFGVGMLAIAGFYDRLPEQTP